MRQAPLKTLSSVAKRTNFHTLLNREIVNSFVVSRLKVIKMCDQKVYWIKCRLKLMVIKAMNKTQKHFKGFREEKLRNQGDLNFR